MRIAGVWLGMGMALAAGLAASSEEAQRADAYTSRSPEAARAWQAKLRREFFALLKLDDLVASRPELEPAEASSADKAGYVLKEVSVRTTPGRRMTVAVAVPRGEGPFPAVVAIHGHGGTRTSPFDASGKEQDRIYKAFGARLAERGFVVVAPDVAQHEVYEAGRTLMGERLWDCIRCVDLLEAMPEVDKGRIGCGGLSLGGEMAMWLGAMDTRVRATVSAGFLTKMDQMERNHCMCWKFEGLRERVDWPDVYAMIAPRALQCQNGLKEPENDFTVPLARKALEQVQVAYRDFDAADRVELDVHDGGHEIDLEPLLAFFERQLRSDGK